MQEIEHLERCKLLIYIILFVSLNVTYSQDLHYNKSVEHGVHRLLNEEFDKARKNFKSYGLIDSTIFPKVLLLITDVFEWEHDNNAISTGAVDSSIIRLKDSTETLLKKNSENLEFNYTLALIMSASAYWEAFRNNYLKSFADGFIARQYFEKCLTLDSTSIEYKCAIGNYKYWSSVKTESLHWLPFVFDESKSGLIELELCFSEKFFIAEFMKFSLAWAYLNENLFEEAELLIKDLIKRYPKSLKVKILQAAYLEDFDQTRSLNLYNTILAKYKEADIVNPAREIELSYRIADLNFRLNNFEKSIEICQHYIDDADTNAAYYEALKLNIDEFVKLRDTLITTKSALPEN